MNNLALLHFTLVWFRLWFLFIDQIFIGWGNQLLNRISLENFGDLYMPLNNWKQSLLNHSKRVLVLKPRRDLVRLVVLECLITLEMFDELSHGDVMIELSKSYLFGHVRISVFYIQLSFQIPFLSLKFVYMIIFIVFIRVWKRAANHIS